MKELDKSKVYSLEGLTDEQLKKLVKKVEINLHDLRIAKCIIYNNWWKYSHDREKATASALDLFEEEIIIPSPHYNNDKGSLYQFCEAKELNSYEFDIIKRVMRCRKKGQFIEDLEKTKYLIDLYIKEQQEIK